MKRLALFVSLLVVFSACFNDRDVDTRHRDVQAKAAECYGYLVEGNIEAYLGSIHDYDSLPEEYQTQLHDLFAQYLDKERRTHGGLCAARVIGDTLLDSVSAQAFLEVTFGDSTVEQVSLPLVRVNDKWLLK